MSSTEAAAATFELTKRILGDLVAYPSVSGRPNSNIVGYIVDYLDQYGIKADIDPNPEGDRFNLFATIGNLVNGGIALSGHMDVVSADPTQWTGDPFILRSDGDRLIGRGAVDMKGFLACTLAMVPTFVANAGNFKKPLHLAFTFDEEVGCFGAAQYRGFLERLGIRPDIAIIGEPTGMLPVVGHKAGIEMITRITGTAGHAADPRSKVNAIFAAARLIEQIESVAQKCADLSDPASPFDPPFTTLNVGRIVGGEGRNIVPDSVEFLWEIRPTPPDDGRAVLNEIVVWANQTLVPEMKKVDLAAGIDIIELAYCPGMDARYNSPAVMLIERLWTKAKPTVISFGTDGGHFQRMGMETVVFGPGRMDQMHQPEEYIRNGDLIDCLKFMERLNAYLAS